MGNNSSSSERRHSRGRNGSVNSHDHTNSYMSQNSSKRSTPKKKEKIKNKTRSRIEKNTPPRNTFKNDSGSVDLILSGEESTLGDMHSLGASTAGTTTLGVSQDMSMASKNASNSLDIGGKDVQSRGNGRHHASPSAGMHLLEDANRSAQTNIIQDETVKVNLAMADLMAYLQVVANNSSNLPLTSRDDPELGRTVSTLTAEEYARKSSAFLPSDVKIIAGSFLKYGRVWDLPTSEEFSPSDSTQEPSVSHGGACCNSMLKVLYDTESEAAQAVQVDYTSAANLFDEESESGVGRAAYVDNSSKSFDSLVLGDISTLATITWSDILRSMKAEMQATGYLQMPTVTSSRKFDLNTPFSLIPQHFDPSKNKKRSLLIGCNYSDQSDSQLKASHDDIRSVKDFIVNVHGFPETRGLMTVLLDDGVHKPPTHLNITEAFKSLSEQSQPGDAVFVQFAGHGCRILDSPIDVDVESYDEAIIPSDFKVSGMIRDTLIFKTLLAPMRYGVTVTCLLDCSSTGVMVDLPYSWSTKNDRPELLPKMSLNDDFSFVRFLKVVKTLYESSTFTQLGRTVRSVLNEKSPNVKDYVHEEEQTLDDSTIGGGSLVTMESETDGIVPKQATNSLLNALTACHSPKAISPARDLNSEGSNVKDGKSMRDGGSMNGEGPSLFQQVLNCAFNNPAESDDDTFHPTPTDEEEVLSYENTDGGSYDSMTDDGAYQRGDDSRFSRGTK